MVWYRDVAYLPPFLLFLFFIDPVADSCCSSHGKLAVVFCALKVVVAVSAM